MKRRGLSAQRRRPPSKIQRVLIKRHANNLGISIHQLLKQFGLDSLASHYDAARVIESIRVRERMSRVNKVVVV